MKGKLYGVGVGPGDAEVITIKAVKVLKSVDFIALPDTGAENTALEIVKSYVEGKEFIYCPAPMTHNENQLIDARQKSFDLIADKLDKGFDVAYITLGDPTIYSTYMYLHRLLLSCGYGAQIISGVPSFCSAAAALNISLCDGAMPLYIIPASYPNAEELLKVKGNKVLMKTGRELGEVKSILKSMNLHDKARMVERCTMSGERIYKNLDDASDDASYFSIIIIKED